MDRVDVLLSARGGREWLGRALAAVRAEPPFDLRVFLRGDAAGDGVAAGGVGPRVEVLAGGADVGAALRAWEARSDAPFVLVVAAAAVLLPGAIRRMQEATAADGAVAQVVGVAIPVCADGTADRDRVRSRTQRHLERLQRLDGVAYLAAFGDAEVGAVLFRRAVVAGDDGVRARGAGWIFPTVLATAARGATVVLADPVAGMPDAPNGGGRGVAARLGAARRRWEAYAHDDAHRPRLPTAGVVAALGLEGARRRLHDAGVEAWRQLAARTLEPLGERLYDLVLSRLSDWPIGGGPPGAAPSGRGRPLAYYVWRFPIPSETFIRRELRALAGAGVRVTIVADAPGEGGADDPELGVADPAVRYLHPIPRRRVLGDLLGWLAQRPLRTLNLLAYTICRPYRAPKSLGEDGRVYLKAVHLAAVLREAGVGHVHSPWGDTNAFVAMVAAHLAGIGFSLQFRAHDLHRRTSAFLIAEKVRNARFVVTNTDFNLAHLHARVPPADRGKIHRIYNGLELSDPELNGRELRHGATPAPARAGRADGEITVLSVARLIEPKGLPDLFAACRLLRDRGHPVRCRIIGGPELPQYVNDLIAIRSAHRRLALDGCVELLGARPFVEVAAAYREADVFVLPCVVGRDGSNDITPNALLEAMAAGLPVVSTTITAIPELVQHEVSGLLVPPNDAAALADAIERLIAEPGLRARLGDAARRRMHERFDVARNIGAYVELFTAP